MIRNLKIKVACGLLFILIGVSLFFSDFVVQKREETFTRVNVELNDLLAINDTVEENEDTTDDTVLEETPVEENIDHSSSQYETFAGVLNIPKINFSKGFYPKGSELNNVKFNLKILDVSSYPDEKRGNVIIIGHSGNYSNSYFGNLYQLALDDVASIQYQGKTYSYKIVNIYNQEKDGTVTIYRDVTKNCLTLVTCTKDSETQQTVYIFELIGVE